MNREEAEAKGLASSDPAADLRERLRRLAPGAFPDGVLDFERLKGLLGGLVEAGRERFGLVWHGREQCLRDMQERSTATLKPDRGASKDFDATGNLFIEGDNLEALKLLQKAYAGGVKMIFIDPPYNTGNDFLYSDRWGEGLESYLRFTGQRSGGGESLAADEDTAGRRHSRWLSMMWPRLFLARNLLREDGAIFITIDETEHAHLKMLCDSIFGEHCFAGSVSWKKTSGDNTASFTSVHDNILIYGKGTGRLPRAPMNETRRKAYKNPDNDPRGDWTESNYRNRRTKEERPNLHYAITRPDGEEIFPDTYSSSGRTWHCDRETHLRNVKMNLVWWGPNGDAKEPKKKIFLSEHRGLPTRSLWLEHGTNNEAGRSLNEMMGGDFFDYPKPVLLIEKMLEIMAPVGDELILDFFAGSCTTAHAVMRMNARDGGARRFVCVQLPEPCGENSAARGAGFRTIADLGRERIRRAGARIAKEREREKGEGRGGEGLDLGFRAFRLAPSNFRIWDDSPPPGGRRGCA